MTVLQNFFYKNAQKRIYSKKFQNIFGVKFDRYFSNLLGFDIVKFDKEVIKSPNGVSMEQQIRNKYGDEVVKLIKCLLE